MYFPRSSRNLTLVVGAGILVASPLIGNWGSKDLVETCNGNKITVRQMERELRAARYNGPWGDRNVELTAYNNAACREPNIVVQACDGRTLTLDEMMNELKQAGYDGPFDGKKDVEAYNRAACPERR